MRRVTEESYRERVLAALVHIQAHLDEPLPLDQLARVACFSRYHFHRIFRGMVGEPVKEHVRRLRLERAAQRLKAGRQPVTEIALDAGYESLESFTRAFGAAFGLSPTAYRRSRRSTDDLPAPAGVHFDLGGPTGFMPISWGGTAMEVRIQRVDAMRVAFMRHVGPYHEMGQTFERLGAWAGPRGLFGAHTRVLGVYHDDPEVTPPDKLRGDACITVGESFQPEGEVGVQTVGGGEYAVATHRGPYSGLVDVYARLCGEWAPGSGRELRSAPCFEIYLNSPHDTAPEDLLTEVYAPLEEAG